MNGFEKRAEKIKGKIKHTTLELLSNMEPRNIRITDIANSAKVSQVTIYNYFGSKDDLINEALKSYYVDTLTEYEQYISNSEHTFQETIRYIMFQKKETVHKFSANKLNEIMLQNPEMKKFVEEIYSSRVLPLVVKMIDNAKQRNEIKRDIPASLILFYINIFSDKTEELLKMSNSYQSEEKYIEDLLNLFFYGLAGKVEDGDR
ncbi:TetR/AcrR family transcriptional regulator [Metabacillus litoralis]|uniref:TetR/AcrR family transcriptional regulator n=1 Tax=Metabacillus litoralis TaxID=152268 RepID=UPI001CFD08F9|nr:TetR/AcrR family transcriptional regulator [Metabacillus litoralis]